MKRILIVILISTLLELAVCPSRLLGYGASSMIGFIAFFLMYLFLEKKFRPYFSPGKIAIYMLIGYLLMDMPVRLPHIKATLCSLPDVLLQMSGIIGGYVACKFFPQIKYIPFFLGLAICVYMFFQGYELYYNKLHFGYFTPEVSIPYSLPENFLTPEGDTVTFKKEKQYVLLYCWNEYCGACINSFPLLRKLHKNAPDNFKVYAAHCPLREEPLSKTALQRAKSIQVPVLWTKKGN